jgi:hypothetical protein
MVVSKNIEKQELDQTYLVYTKVKHWFDVR